jgi:ubiquinone/menaquinone biosynthesis C-methylase UbiE
MKVLDIGFGTGFPAIEIAGRLGKSSVVYGVDLWKEGTEQAKKKAVFRKINNLKLLDNNAEKLPFFSNYFHLIISNNGINNVDNIQQVFFETYRTLKKKGKFIFTFNLPDTMKEFYSAFKFVLKKNLLMDEIEKMKKHIWKLRKPVSYMKKELTNTGFKNIKIIRKKFEYKFPDSDSMFEYFIIREFFLPEWKTIVDKQIQKKIFTEVKKLLERTVNKKGFITLVIPYAGIICEK